MPLLTDWLDMEPTSQPGAKESVFSQPTISRTGRVTGLPGVKGSIFDEVNQKKIDTLSRFSAYQQRMRQDAQDQQTELHAATATQMLSSLNPRDPTYPDAVAEVVGKYPLAGSHPSVRNLLQAQHSAYSEQRYAEQRQMRDTQEVMQAVAERPDLANIYDNELRVSGEDGARRKVKQQLWNDTQHAAIAEAKPDVTDAELDSLRSGGMFNPVAVAGFLGRQKNEGARQKIESEIYRINKDKKKAELDGETDFSVFDNRINALEAELGGEQPQQPQAKAASPNEFGSIEEAEAAGRSGELKPGTKIIVNGRSATYNP